MSSTDTAVSILDDSRKQEREHVVELLTKAYWMEIETVMNYVAGSINPDGVRARRIAESLEEDVQEELGHAKLFGQRIKDLYGVVPSSTEFKPEQDFMRPPEHQTDVVELIRGVIEAETGAIEHYNRIIAETEEIDPVTQDMVIDILHDEEGHRRLFEGFPREYEQEGRA
jgi:bacterioferritin